MTDYADQQRLITALRDVQCFPHAARTVKVIETHISWVLLAGRYAYKIKKSVDLGFLNFTTLEARRFYCLEEIRLNQRLARKIYLDVVPIAGNPEAPRLIKGQSADSSPPIEYAVRMHRFAAARLMDHQLARGKITSQHIDRLAAKIGSFHDSLPAAPADSTYGSSNTIHTAAMQNFAHLQPLLTAEADRSTLDKLRQATETEHAKCAMHFEKRRSQGLIRECHGDLHLGNIVVIGDDPVPFDGIEFNPDLRWIDLMNEVAFTVMDLLHRGHPELAFRFLNAYLEHTGDYSGMAVLRYYLAYRAMVRAKVSAIRAYQPELPAQDRKTILMECRSYLALAAQCLTQRRPALIITHGLPGSGKSVFAQAALQKLQAIRIRSDVERKRLFGLGALDDSRSRAGAGIYNTDATQRTYARLFELAQELLEAGYPVIVDAAFLKREERMQFKNLAVKMRVPFAIASIQAQLPTLQHRIKHRHELAHDASEADLHVLDLLYSTQEPLANDELDCAALFVNEGVNDIIGLPGWSTLSELLGSSFRDFL